MKIFIFLKNAVSATPMSASHDGTFLYSTSVSSAEASCPCMEISPYKERHPSEPLIGGLAFLRLIKSW